MLFLLTGAVAGMTLFLLIMIALGFYLSLDGPPMVEVCWPDALGCAIVFGGAGAGINFLFRLYEVAL